MQPPESHQQAPRLRGLTNIFWPQSKSTLANRCYSRQQLKREPRRGPLPRPLNSLTREAIVPRVNGVNDAPRPVALQVMNGCSSIRSA
jgi:hypothetical protein